MEQAVKIAFVTPWYGPDIPGGMEAVTRNTAEQLHKAGLTVEILTTCIKEFHADWGSNYHRAGTEIVNGVTVRRFPVQKRNRQLFDQINWRLMNQLPITAVQEQSFIEEMFRVPALYDYMAQHYREYIFFLIPYMFATTYFGGQVCPERSVIVPCLHDESYARLGIYQELLTAVKGMLFHSEAERQLTEQLYGPANGQIRAVVGGGLETDFEADGARFQEKYGLDRPFLLYAGRRDEGKNVPLLIEYWRRYVLAERPYKKLVLIGPGEVHIPADVQSYVVDLGFVPAQDKLDAYAAAAVLCQPSINESFSIVIMESWLAGTPVLVHNDCAVTQEHCRQANGGLYFANYEEFAATLNYLFDHPEVAEIMARNGRHYVLENFRWPVVIAKYQQLIEKMVDTGASIA